MSKHDLQVSFQRQIRQVTVNDQTKLGEFIRRALDIFDLKIEQVAGIKYFLYQSCTSAGVFLGNIKFQHAYTFSPGT